MTLYAIFLPTPNKDIAPIAVAERFSWFAAVFPPLYGLAHGLWLMVIFWVAGLVGLYLAGDYVGDQAVVWLYLLLALWLGFEAPDFRRAALVRRGWRYRTDIIASGRDGALVEYLKQK